MRTRRVAASTALLLIVGAGTTSCGSTKGTASRSTAPAPTAGASSPSSAPKTSTAADSQYYVDLATADPSLSSYVDGQSNVALRALLTDGVAFCDFLYRGSGIDNAMMSVAAGANGVESSTHLPMSVKTFNSIDAAALLALCPSAQKLIPVSDQASLRQLAKALAASQPAGT